MDRREILNRTIEAIKAADPARLDMLRWEHCIAGYVCRAVGASVEPDRRTFLEWLTRQPVTFSAVFADGADDVDDAARRALDMTDREADALFYLGDWPAELAEAYKAAWFEQDDEGIRNAMIARLNLAILDIGWPFLDVAAGAELVETL